MYKGKKTLFWNGETLWEAGPLRFDGRPVIYTEEERKTWEVIIVLPGVEVIPDFTFCNCRSVKTVIMANSVRRIEGYAFSNCKSLVFVKLSTNLEFIGDCAFWSCKSLTSIFIPPSCREIDNDAFFGCKKLIIFSVPRNTQLGDRVMNGTALARVSPFETNGNGYYGNGRTEEVNEWIRNRHTDNQEFSLHRACASYNPLEEVIFNIVQRQGIGALKKPDSVGVTPSQYLSENPFAEIKEHKIMKRYILEMMGEIV